MSHPELMEFLIVAMMIATGLGVAVVGLVAVPAHRDGRDVLTARGEGVVPTVRQRVGAPGRSTTPQRR